MGRIFDYQRISELPERSSGSGEQAEPDYSFDLEEVTALVIYVPLEPLAFDDPSKMFDLEEVTNLIP